MRGHRSNLGESDRLLLQSLLCYNVGIMSKFCKFITSDKIVG